MKKLTITEKAFFLFAIFLVILSCAVNPVTGKKQIMLMSEAQEAQMGAQYDPQVMATFGEYKNDKLLSFIQARADEIGKISQRSKMQFHVRLLDTPVVNAFAVPGGYVYITRGILAQFNNEAELVGVLGHEMGHVVARHSASQQSKQQIGQLLLIGGMIASQKFAQYAEYAMQGMQLLFLKFSRDDESQADRLGVAYASKIGYDANKMADFFQVLNKMSMKDGQNGVPTFLSTHPDPADRYTAVHHEAKVWQDSLKRGSWTVNGDEYLAMIDGIVYGEDPQQGYVEGNTFYHPVLKFKFNIPSGWQLENQPTQVNMAPQDGKALIVFTLSQDKTLEQAAQNTLKQLDLKVQESKSTNINGMPALVTLSKQVAQDQSTGQTQTNIVESTFINFSGTIYVFHGVTTEADFNNFNPIFSSTMTGFSKLTDASKLNVKPKHINIIKVQRTGTLADALKANGMQQKQMEELSLLNNMELNAQVQAGKLIKVFGQ
jgi:predicted Zn-dependent protease